MAFLSYFIACFSCSFRSFASSFILIFFFFFSSLLLRRRSLSLWCCSFFILWWWSWWKELWKSVYLVQSEKLFMFHMVFIFPTREIQKGSAIFTTILSCSFFFCYVPCWLANWLNRLYDQDMIELSSNNIKTLSFRHKALWSRFCIKDDRKIHSYQRQRQQQRCETFFFFCFAFVSKNSKID